MDTFDAIAQERRGIADLFDQLTPQQLAEPSLCGAWTVHDVAAHLVTPLEVRTWEFLLTMLASGGSFDRANRKLTARRAGWPIHELTATLRSHAESRFTPPGMGPAAPLTDLLVHGLDVRRPLKISRTIPAERIRTCLDFLTARPRTGFVPTGRLTGLRLHATDLDWSAGSGPAVHGTAEDLLLAATGRPTGAQNLSGEGADTLCGRLQQ